MKDFDQPRVIVMQAASLLMFFNTVSDPEHVPDTPKRGADRRALRQKLEANRAKWRKLRSEIRFVEPKSTRSRRTIRMPQVVTAALRSHRKRQREERMALGKAWHDSGLVFVSPIGTPLDPRNMTREFQSMLVAA